MLSCSPEALEEALARFVRDHAIYEAIATSIAAEAQSICDDAVISCRSSGRAKDLRSFHKKVIEKGYADPWAEVTDKAGARLIMSTAVDVDRAVSAIRTALGDRVIGVEDKRNVLSPSALGYSGVHLQVRTELDGVEYECELQLRTGAQDLWSTMSHKYLYKPVVELPTNIQHAAYRLVAIMELFDEEAQRIVAYADQQSDTLPARLIPLLEGHYLKLAHAPSNRQVGAMIIDAVADAFEPDEVDNYPDTIGSFVASKQPELEQLYSEYGPHSAVAYLPAYVVFGQAESLALLERLSTKRHKVAAAWARAGMPRSYLEAVATAAGYDLP